MARDITRLDTQLALRLFGDWTDRIAAGELPFAKPERPRGIERNVVITQWDWGRPTAYLHDVISTDPRNPQVNADGRIYGSPEDSSDFVPILDPKTNVASEVLHPVRDPNTPSTKTNPMAPSSFWGPEPIWDGKTLNHNPMMDEKGRVWFTPRVRPEPNPDFCRQGSDHPSARAFPLQASGRHLSMFDPATGRFTLISTCFPTHHLNSHATRIRHCGPARALADPASLAGSIEGGSRKPATRSNRRGGRRSSSTPTVTAGATRMSSPISRSIAAKDTRVASTPMLSQSVRRTVRSGEPWCGYRGASFAFLRDPIRRDTALTEIYDRRLRLRAARRRRRW